MKINIIHVSIVGIINSKNIHFYIITKVWTHIRSINFLINFFFVSATFARRESSNFVWKWFSKCKFIHILLFHFSVIVVALFTLPSLDPPLPLPSMFYQLGRLSRTGSQFGSIIESIALLIFYNLVFERKVDNICPVIIAYVFIDINVYWFLIMWYFF